MTSCAQESKQKNENTNKPAKTFGKGASAIEKIRALNKETSALKSLEPLKVKELENWSKELQYKSCILETGVNQTEAIGLYKKNNYHHIV